MPEWNLAVKIAAGGFGYTLVVLGILSIIIWLIGFVIQRRTKKE